MDLPIINSLGGTHSGAMASIVRMGVWDCDALPRRIGASVSWLRGNWGGAGGPIVGMVG
jgi:hypothetical protein